MSEEVVKPKRQVRWGFVFVGTIGLTASLGAIAIETVRNYGFGARGIDDSIAAMISGGTCAMFAVLLAVLPFLARPVGWQQWMRVFFVGCMLVTGYCGVAYYVDDIRAKARDAMSLTTTFQDARRELAAAEAERDRAQGEADRIAQKESRSVKALDAIYKAAKEKQTLESSKERKGCGTDCKAAEAQALAALNALGDAEARERAQARADEAQKRLDAAKKASQKGPAEASGMAGLAGDLGGNAMRYAAIEALAVPVVKVVLMLGAAALLDISLTVLCLGFGIGATEKAETLKPKLVAKPKANTKAMPVVAVSAVERVHQLPKPKTDLELAIERCVQPADEPTTSPADLYKHLKSFWDIAFPGKEMPNPTVLGKAMKAAGYKKSPGGNRLYYCKPKSYIRLAATG